MENNIFEAKPFNLRQVRLLDGPFKAAMQRDQDYLLQLEPDRFLHTFRVTAGLPSNAEPYGGWESPEIELRGHSLGHYLSACALMVESTDDDRFKSRVDYIVAELEKCQQAMPSQGYNQGFLSAFPETFFDRVDRRRSVWAPYYTLHKILAGLFDAYLHGDNSQALSILKNMADWLQLRISRLTYEEQQIALLNEFGGMNDVLTNLYSVTQNPAHLKLAQAFNDDVTLDPLAQGEDHLDRKHANTQIPKIIGVARQYEVTGDANLRDLVTFFWQRVAFHRSYAIGGNSDDELFFPVNRFADHLTPLSAETCNTHNMLKLTRHLFSWQPSAELMDFYERALINHILASQDPETGMMIYFASLKPGHFKIYNSPTGCFWCCTGTGMESHAKYGDTIYFHDANTLYINLFIASELTWAEKGLLVKQETAFPEEGTTHLTLHCEQPITLAVKLRYPRWAQGFSIRVNGQEVATRSEPGSYVSIEREWHDGDQITVEMKMNLHVEALPDAPDTIAVLYGPLVLAGALGKENLPDVYSTVMHARENPLNDVPVPQVPVLKGTSETILNSIEPVDGKPLTFKTRGIGSPDDVQLIPFYQMHHQRYTVYWQLISKVNE